MENLHKKLETYFDFLEINLFFGNELHLKCIKDKHYLLPRYKLFVSKEGEDLKPDESFFKAVGISGASEFDLNDLKRIINHFEKYFCCDVKIKGGKI